MDTVSVRDLRNRGGQVLQRVADGETLTVTMDGEPIAELRPVAPRALSAETLLRRWRHLPPVNAAQLRADIDRIVDTAL
jgi:prevent-host-death family protein